MYKTNMEYVNEIVGKVVKGLGIGEMISYPTINVQSDNIDLEFGVFACAVRVNEKEFKGAMHYGPRKVVSDEKPSLEVFLFDFNGDLYNQDVTIKVYGKIRDTRDFEDLMELKVQIKEDVEEVRKFFKK
ncbi:riboflavin kinase [Pseudomonadota bacterium]